MVCMAGLQVFIVRFFFQGARKGEFGELFGFGLKGFTDVGVQGMYEYGHCALGNERVIYCLWI